MKFYILVNRKLEYLKDHLKTIPRSDQVVVINSLDNDFIDQASAYCQEMSIEYYVTESDGTAATGKNSVMKLFLESDNEYMVQVDGDDKITDYGYKAYKALSRHKNPPDLVVIRNQFQFRYLSYRILPDGTKKPIGGERSQPWLRSKEWMEINGLHEHYRFHYYGKLQNTKSPKLVCEVYDAETVMGWAIEREIFENFFWNMGEGDNDVRELFNRMTFYSRKAAEHVKFDNTLNVGEDTMEFLRLKKMCYDKKLNVVRFNEYPTDKDVVAGQHYHTYLYQVKDEDGVVMSDGREDDKSWCYDWMIKLNRYVEDNNLEEEYKCLKGWYLKDFDRKQLDI